METVIQYLCLLLLFLRITSAYGSVLDDYQSKIDDNERAIEAIDSFIDRSQTFDSMLLLSSQLKKSRTRIVQISYNTRDIYTYPIAFPETRSWSVLHSRLLMVSMNSISDLDENRLVKAFKDLLKQVRVLLYHDAMKIMGDYTMVNSTGKRGVLRQRYLYQMPVVKVKKKYAPSVFVNDEEIIATIGREMERFIKITDDDDRLDDPNDPNVSLKELMARLSAEDKWVSELQVYLNEKTDHTFNEDLTWIKRLLEKDYFKSWSFEMEVTYGDNPEITYENIFYLLRDFVGKMEKDSNHSKKMRRLKSEVKTFLHYSYVQYLTSVLWPLERQIVTQESVLQTDNSLYEKRYLWLVAHYGWLLSDYLAEGALDLLAFAIRSPLEMSAIRLMDLMNNNLDRVKSQLANLESDLRLNFNKETDIQKTIDYLDHAVSEYPIFAEMVFKNNRRLEDLPDQLQKFYSEHKDQVEIMSEFRVLLNRLAYYVQLRSKGFLVPALNSRIRDLEAQNWSFYHPRDAFWGYAVQFGSNILRKGEVGMEWIEKKAMEWTDNARLRQSYEDLVQYLNM